MGRYRGTIGDVTYTSWKGQPVAKQKVPDTNTSNSPAQVTQRLRFALLGKISRMQGPALRVGFKTQATSTTEQNVFVSLNKEAVTVVNGAAVVDLTKIVISLGNVGPLAGLVGTYTPATGRLVATWTNNSNGNDALPTDLVSIGALTPNGAAGSTLVGAGTRAAAAAGVYLQLPTGLAAAQIRVYGFAKRADSRETSNSVQVAAV